MSDSDPSERPPAERAEMITAMASAQAPVIYADTVTMFGQASPGVTGLTLECHRSMAMPSGPLHDRIAVAHLRLSEEAMRTLRQALDRLEVRPASDTESLPSEQRPH